MAMLKILHMYGASLYTVAVISHRAIEIHMKMTPGESNAIIVRGRVMWSPVVGLSKMMKPKGQRNL